MSDYVFTRETMADRTTKWTRNNNQIAVKIKCGDETKMKMKIWQMLKCVTMFGLAFPHNI